MATDDEWITIVPGDPAATVAAPPADDDWKTVPASARPAAPGYGQQAGNVARIASNALTFGQWDRCGPVCRR